MSRSYGNIKDARQYLRDAQGYIEHAIENIDGKDVKPVLQCMARVRECLTEARWNIRGCPVKNGRRA